MNTKDRHTRRAGGAGAKGPRAPAVSGSGTGDRQRSGRRTAAIVLLAVEFLGIVWFSAWDERRQHQLQELLQADDKFLHAAAFLLAGVTANLAFRSPALAGLVLAAAAAGIELLQFLVDGRTASFPDFVASAAGAAAGLAGTHLVRLALRRR